MIAFFPMWPSDPPVCPTPIKPHLRKNPNLRRAVPVIELSTVRQFYVGDSCHKKDVRRDISRAMKHQAGPIVSVEDAIKKLRGYAFIATGDRDKADIALVRALNKLLDFTENRHSDPSFDYTSHALNLLETELRSMNSFDPNLRSKAYVLMELQGLSAEETSQILDVDMSEIEVWGQEFS